MRQITTPAIVLRRTNYGEADRIITFLTPGGKLKALVKGVRRSKSKLAGGIELFSESSVTFIETKGDLARIISTRLNLHWDGIVGELNRMMFGYEAMKLMDKVIEDEAESEYYDLLKNVLSGLNDQEISLEAIEVWYETKLLNLLGHGINLKTDAEGARLVGEQLYGFSAENMCFTPSSKGEFREDHIKLLRLCSAHKVEVLKQVKNIRDVAPPLKPLLKNLIQHYT